MRHGQTLFNEKKKIQGASDSPLTQLGIEQARMAKNYFDELHLNRYTHLHKNAQVIRLKLYVQKGHI